MIDGLLFAADHADRAAAMARAHGAACARKGDALQADRETHAARALTAFATLLRLLAEDAETVRYKLVGDKWVRSSPKG